MAIITRTKTWSTGEVLTAAHLNAEFDGIVDNLDPTGINDESTDAAEQQATRDPYGSDTRVPSLSLEHELQTLRYQIKALTGTTYWYENALGYVWIPADIMRSEATAPVAGFSFTDDGTLLIPLSNEYATNDINMSYWQYEQGPGFSELAYANFVFPSDWDLGTVKAKFYWTCATGATIAETVKFSIRLTAFSDSDVIDVAKGTQQVIQDALTAANGTDMQITDATPAITVGGTTLAIGDLINMSVQTQDPTGAPFAETTWLFGVMIQYKKGSANAAW